VRQPTIKDYQRRLRQFVGFCQVNLLTWTSALELDKILVQYLDDLFFLVSVKDEGIRVVAALKLFLGEVSRSVAEGLSRASRSPLGSLWNHSYQEYKDTVAQSLIRLNVVFLGLCLYSLRHGGVITDLLGRRRPVEEVKKRGPLASDSSVKRYDKEARLQSKTSKVPAAVLKFGASVLTSQAKTTRFQFISCKYPKNNRPQTNQTQRIQRGSASSDANNLSQTSSNTNRNKSAKNRNNTFSVDNNISRKDIAAAAQVANVSKGCPPMGGHIINKLRADFRRALSSCTYDRKRVYLDVCWGRPCF
jgi:hypothetical protein